MRFVDGVSITKNANYALCHITDFTDEIKNHLREQLSFICYGRSCSESGKDLYNYRNTLKEFLSRYKNKSANLQKGMLGELLAHLVINLFFDNTYYVASPFFNIEERSIKKGFDVVLSSKRNCELWITEVKSGELHSRKDVNSTTLDLLSTAKNDLENRLNESNRSLWLNAINGAKTVFERHDDLKDSIVEILENHGTVAETTNSYRARDTNVFLISALFASMNDLAELSTVENKFNLINDESVFKKLFILSIQKGTFKKVVNFLEGESFL